MTGYRQIVGLKWARRCARPACIPKTRPRGVKAKGLRYENQVAKAMPGCTHGQWVEFCDLNGHGYAQVDLILPYEGAIWALECKLSDTKEAQSQLSALYLPLLRHMWPGKPCYGVIVAKYVTPSSSLIVESLALAMTCARASPSRVPVLHWPGRHTAALLPPSTRSTQEASFELARTRALA